ncbi:MAG: hypothetical protein JO103_00260 [Candidatus Eremiobacteraeota bacterium]|nr:hypothetical protein [Candidatus Eremiobacteraeota bacterium]
MFSPTFANSVSVLPFDVRAVDRGDGALDAFDHVDGFSGAAPHLRAYRVPLGAPLVVGGWGLDPGGQPHSDVIAVIDDTLGYAAQIGFSRRDVVVKRGSGTPEYSGFRLVLPTAGLVPGAHGVRAYGLGSDAAWYEIGQQGFWVFDAARPELGVTPHALRIEVDGVDDLTETGALRSTDHPLPVGDVAVIRGWAIDLETSRGPAGVFATAATGHRWSSSCELVRADAARAHAIADDRIGFEITVQTDVLGRGRHTLRVGAVDAHGRPFGRTSDVTLDVAAQSRWFPALARLRDDPATCEALFRRADGTVVVLDALTEIEAERGEIFELEGWVVGRDGRAATDVFLELHHPETIVPPNRHFPLAGIRRDRPPRWLSRPPHEDAWFWYRLGTANLAPRSYGLMLAVVASDRRSYVRRALGRLTISARKRSVDVD